MVSTEQKDEALTQLLSMVEDGLDAEQAQILLEAMNWDVQAALESLFGGPTSPGHSRPPSAVPQHPGAFHPGAFLGGGGGGDADTMLSDGDDVMVEDGEEPALRGDSRSPPHRNLAAGMGQQMEDDAHLAAAIAASYEAQTIGGRRASEDELLAQALRMSQQEEETRQRQNLRQQQEAELAESILMDQMREQQEKARVEQEREMAAAIQAAEQERVEQEQRAKAELEAKRTRLPAEPPAGEPGRLMLMFKLPSGSLKRAFRSTETVGLLYDYVDTHWEEAVGQKYKLVSRMPRQEFEDRQKTLADAGIQNQFVLIVEVGPDNGASPTP